LKDRRCFTLFGACAYYRVLVRLPATLFVGAPSNKAIKPGMPLEVRWEKGAIAITPAPLTVMRERKRRLLVAITTKDTPRLSTDIVERTRKTLRKERSGAST
jgi:hypothetical protein